MSQPANEEAGSGHSTGRPVIQFEILAPKLDLISSEIAVGVYRAQLPEPNDLGLYWAGAGIGVAKFPQEIDGCFIVVTSFAAEVAWFYATIFPVAYEANIIDYFSKFEFAGKLGQCVVDFHSEPSPRRKTRKALLLAMVQCVRVNATKFDIYGDALNPE